MKSRLVKSISRIIFLLSVMVVFHACNKSTKQDDKTLFGKEKPVKENLKLHRFDKALFEYNNQDPQNKEQYLLSLEKEYKPMFAASLSDKQYLSVIKSFVEDEQMRQANKLIAEAYPDLNWLEDGLAEALGRIRSIRSDHAKSEIYTLILGPAEYSFAYQNRILVYPEFSAISLDLYSMNVLSSHPYYKTIPEYLRGSLTKDNILPDYVRVYLQEITFRDVPLQSQNPEATLLDCIIDEGKYAYAVSSVLPRYKLQYVLRYTEQQQKWVEQNEYNIWSYIIQNQLLYCKDRTKYLSLIAEGPTTRGISDSPSRIGNYIGYKIVEAYMNENSITIDSLFKINDSEVILKSSKYKPSKQ